MLKWALGPVSQRRRPLLRLVGHRSPAVTVVSSIRTNTLAAAAAAAATAASQCCNQMTTTVYVLRGQ